MLDYLKVKWHSIIGNPDNFTLESRIFHAFSIFGIITSSSESVFNLVAGFYTSLIITAFLGITQAGCYYISRFKNKGKLAIIVVLVETNIATAFAYFYNSGIYGSTLLLFAITLFVTMLIVQKRQWVMWFMINLATVLSIIIWEYYRPGIIQVHYNNRLAMFMDITFSYIIVATLIFVCTKQMRKNYSFQLNLTEEKAVKLQELHNEKDKLFSIISHDLNAPLASLRQYLDLLGAVDIESAERGVIEKDLAKSVNSAQELLHNLMQWSKSQMKEVIIDMQEINLNGVLTATAAPFYQIAAKKEIELSLAVDQTIFVNADYNMLQLIARNLINNAIKFTPEGGKISVTACTENDRCILAISDNGVGMTPETQSKIFSPGVQSTNGTALETGSGLGLQLVNDYTFRQGGQIWLTSKPGEGTTFYISLKRIALMR